MNSHLPLFVCMILFIACLYKTTVIQRPSSIAKELIENSLDACSTKIEIHCSGGGLSSLVITDDGLGFHPEDLKLAATRFATSKLVHYEDLKSIQTFGFRGEALASCSMVGRLSIISRRKRKKSSSSNNNNRNSKMKTTTCAYKMSYVDGKPKGKAMPSAGKEGTQVKVEDLFYNLPSRKRAFEGSKKENEEYYKILNVVQRYAVHCSKDGIGFVCRKKGGLTDLNTVNLPALKQIQTIRNGHGGDGEDVLNETDLENAVKQTIGHLFGSELTRELLVFKSSHGDVNEIESESLKRILGASKSPKLNVHNGNKHSKEKKSTTKKNYLSITIDEDENKETPIYDAFVYKAFGMCSNATYCATKSSTTFILFINNRLVESSSIRRAVEGVYSDILPRGAKPFIYLSLQVPGLQLDVNVHPTKREVALLHEDKLCRALADAASDLLRSVKTSKTFYTQALLPAASYAPKNEMVVRKRKERGESGAATDVTNTGENDVQSVRKGEKSTYTNNDNNDIEKPKKKKTIYAKDLIRVDTAAEKGSMEPFLRTDWKRKSMNKDQNPTSSKSSSTSAEIFQHRPDCEFAMNNKKIDLNVPGAFALICRCQINQPGLPSLTNLLPATIVRPKKIVPTECSYTSIESLRRDVTSRAHGEITSKLRQSVFVGCVSRHRSLLQSGIELLMVNHNELAKELFYQLALTRFGGFEVASFGNGGLDVRTLVETALQFEDAQNLVKSNNVDSKNDIDSKFSSQIVECLHSHGECRIYVLDAHHELLLFCMTNYTFHFS